VDVVDVVASLRRILLVSGSLRKGSTNSAVLRTAQRVAPDVVDARLYGGLSALPAFNPDLDADPLPGAVADLRAHIRAADGILFSTPEYAGGLPGAFKNLLDWTVGDDRPGSMYEKPVAWLNVAARGAANAHESLRKVLGYVNTMIVEPACLSVPVTSAMVGADGLVADETVIRRIVESFEVLADARPS
jgi:chromate reductase, NAD(P)H dehydrogenase (quinone)